ncbi:MAG: hemerythrin domain-containing protein [Bryobacteraceae bacterium]
MPIAIGGKPESDFTDPIGMLGDCHRRIVRFLHVLVQLAAQKQGGSLTSEERTLLSTSLRYFREAAPKHTADEEESLFPRLRRLDTADVDPMLARIESLEQDHGCADRNHAEIDRLGQSWLADGQLSDQAASQFRNLADHLEKLYRHHISVEDNEVFPFAARVLTPEEQQAIGNEMAARRGIGRAVLTSPQLEPAEAR